MILAHQIALDLADAQEAYCRRAAGTARFTYNWALAEWQRQYQSGEQPTAAALKTQWNALKHTQFPWVADVHKDANQQPFTHLAQAFQKFFRHEAQYSTFKKKGQHDSFYVSNDKCALQGKRLRLPVLGWVRMHEASRFTEKVMSVTVSGIAHRWFASIAVCIETTPSPCENQVVIEDLHVKGMVRNHHLARAISDIAFGMFRRLLTYKAEMGEVTPVDIAALTHAPGMRETAVAEAGTIESALLYTF